jgi:hypothetical protein
MGVTADLLTIGDKLEFKESLALTEEQFNRPKEGAFHVTCHGGVGTRISSVRAV